jgi:hypothetical protein
MMFYIIIYRYLSQRYFNDLLQYPPFYDEVFLLTEKKTHEHHTSHRKPTYKYRLPWL